jgi:bacterioferritin
MSEARGLQSAAAGGHMPPETQSPATSPAITREDLMKGLQEDLSREYQAILAYVVYSQALKGAKYQSIAQELEVHAAEELSHAITIAKQIDYLGGMPNATALPVKLTDNCEDMLRADLDNENRTVRAYRQRVRQADALGEFAISEEIREILRQEQEHQMDLASALGEDVPDVSKMTD